MLNHFRSAAAIAALVPTTLLAAPAPKCQDTPATFEFLGNVNAVVRIWGDGLGPYVDGAGQVEALLRTCTANGDATLNLLSSTSRTLYFDFSKSTYSNATTPAWTLQAGIALDSYINVRKLVSNYDINKPPTLPRSFTTALTTTLMAPNKSTAWYFRMVNIPNDTGYTDAASNVINSPEATVLVRVDYYPASDPLGERWEVYPQGFDPSAQAPAPAIGTLLQSAKGALINSGQFDVPFKVNIRRKR